MGAGIVGRQKKYWRDFKNSFRTGRNYQPKKFYSMGYMQDIDPWLSDVLTSLEPGVEIEEAKYEIKKKILESYRNGLEAGKIVNSYRNGVEAGKKGDRKPYSKRSPRS